MIEGKNMLKIAPQTLHYARRLGTVRPAPSAAAGKKSRSYLYTFQYDGGDHLSFWCTDNRMILYDELPVSGSDSPWGATSVESWRIDTIAMHLGGGQHDIVLVDGGLQIQRGNLRLRLKCNPETDLAMGQMLLENGERVKINAATLQQILLHMLKGSMNKDLQDRLQTITLFRDGHVMGMDGNVILVAPAPALPFDMSFRKSDARAVSRWLHIVSAELGPQSTGLEPVTFGSGGRNILICNLLAPEGLTTLTRFTAFT